MVEKKILVLVAGFDKGAFEALGPVLDRQEFEVVRMASPKSSVDLALAKPFDVMIFNAESSVGTLALVVDAVRDARPIDTSPFIDGQLLRRWVNESVDKVENQVEEPREAMESLANEINHRIRRNLEREAHLQRKYEELTGREYEEDWWREHQGHPRSFMRPGAGLSAQLVR